jgi:predicted amidophosphoribosyltransferase
MDMDIDPDVLVCPNCGSEFQLHVTHCIDCGTPTKPLSWVGRPPRQDEPPPFFSLSRDAEAQILRVSSLEEAQIVGRFLEEHEVSCRIDPYDPPHLRYGVCVAAEDYDRAMELDLEHMRQLIPDADPSFGELPSTDRCPACGAWLSSHEIECPGCGLVVGSADEEENED